MLRSTVLAVLAAGSVALAGCSASVGGSPGASGGGASSKTVQLATQNNSGVTGAATLTDAGNNKTTVVVAVQANGNNDMPAHIHPGTCATLDPKPTYPLNNVKEGASTTTIDVALADLTKSAFAVNLHKSAAEAQTYVACGDIK